MRSFKVLAVAIGAFPLAFSASAANAATVFDQISLTGPGTDFFGATITDELGAFTHVFNFTLTGPNAANASVTTIELGSIDIDFSSIQLDSNFFTQTGFDPNAENWEIGATLLGAGPHSLTLKGSVVGTSQDGSYSGVMNVVPEPATWGMMILGFGAIGAVMRRRQKVAVRFA